jgi:hypothetical protein
MMFSKQTKTNIKYYFSGEFERGSANVYFDQYYTTQRLRSELVQELLNEINSENVSKPTVLDDGSLLVQVSGEPVLFHQPDEERWLVVYSTALRDRDKKDISDLASLRGWLIEAWIPSDVVDNIYQELTPGEESVNIHRKWDPYWIYQREGEVPEELAEYFDENLDEFVEREIEFSLKTPRRLVNQALEMGATDELLSRSEISKSRFTIQVPESSKVQSDGGVLSKDATQESAGVTVRETGKIAHNSGEVEATLFLLEEIDSRTDLREEFASILGYRDYREHEDGSLELVEYTRPQVLQLVFTEKEFNPEASIKLSNLLTVGQDDVEIHGVVKYRSELEFLTESYTVFDNGEYEVLFTSTQWAGNIRPSVFIRPTNGSASGLLYFYQKLRSKFDPRTEYEIVDGFPELQREEDG